MREFSSQFLDNQPEIDYSNVAQQRSTRVHTFLLQASHLVNPDPKTKFQLARLDRKEAVYSSSKNKPLGKIHDQSEGLPEGMDTLSTSFGKKTPKSLSLGEVVMPNIPPHKLEEEFEKGKELYKKVSVSLIVGVA